MRSGPWLIVAYVAAACLPLIPVTFLGWAPRNLIYELGRYFALTGFMILVVQFVLAARIKRIERPFGFDILIRFHKHMAVFGACLLLAHPLFLALGGAGWRLLIGLDLPWYLWLGKAVLLLLLLNVFLSSFQTDLNVKFERWRSAHDIFAPALLAGGFVHSWVVGHDLQLQTMKVLWVGMLAVALVVYISHRLIGPWRRARRPYRVTEVRPEAEDVWTITLAPPKGEKIFTYLPGQFHFITFFRGRGLPAEEHHWTISSSPDQKGYLSSTIKALGDFTSTIGETREGDTAAVHGPFGRFSYAFHPEERDLVFLAGGIGITPLMSMIRHMRDTRDTRSVQLIYANKTEEQIVFRRELTDIESGPHPRLQVVHVLSRAGESWTGERGRLDQEKIRKFCGEDLSEKVFYVCGPPGMLKAVIAALQNLGVTDKQIRLEIFSFLD